MLEKTYQPAAIEPRIHDKWENAEAFVAGKVNRGENSSAANTQQAGVGLGEPYSIVIPPPNVTGSLHMGHALNNTLQDILCRFERMRGKDVLWQPGTDHAGIATQMVVERQMAERQEPGRRDIGREAFLEKVWAWKAESGGTIVNQLRRLGASCDWSRERFTMDEGLSEAVLKVFVELYEAGLIYKDKRLVNWDPKFQTAISDLEVVQVEATGKFKWSDTPVKSEDGEKGEVEDLDFKALNKLLDKNPGGHMFHFRYPLKDDPSRFIVVATTRPETMLGDSGVAVHPEDERYTDLVGKMVVLPLVGREIPIVADEYSDPEKGTGAVKITPAHDFNDFEVGKRCGLEQINILDEHGAINENAPDAYRGLDRFVARKQILADMHAAGLLSKIEPTTHQVPHGDRSNVVIEPWLTDQWYVNAEELAKDAIKAVENGDTKFVPGNWDKTYFEWMRNIQPWCISRQLWWGHQIPAWYGPDGEVFVAHDEAAAQALAQKHYANSSAAPHPNPLPVEGTGRGDIPLKRDEDVLDTWFSSGLWAFSTLGWPKETPELERYYPTSVLVTGFDIIFFWVARMMMMGLYFKKEVPFRDVYIHALVRDEKGQKMSKSKGNVMDPLDIIDGCDLDTLVAKRVAALNEPNEAKRVEKETRGQYPKGIPPYGADALRFTLAVMAAQGRDIKLSTARIEGYRNFATKLWNASRFAEMNECVRQHDFDPAKVEATVNKWIVSETQAASKAVTAGIEGYRFNEAAGAAYEFVWGVFCDWYLELIKPQLSGDDEAEKAETRACVAWTLDQILKLLHPFMPFITEELWAHMVEHGEQRLSLLTLSAWPELDGLSDEAAAKEIGWVIELVQEIRSVRSEMNVPAGAKIPLVVVGADKLTRERCDLHEDTISRLARLDEIEFGKAAPKGAAMIVTGETTAAIPLEGIIDMEAEKVRLAKEVEETKKLLGKEKGKLDNPQFVAKANPEAIETARERVKDFEDKISRLSAALKRLG
ncbi:MAG: valine--tRNA ligase [Alphaproteobacteria bacterium]|nr:valine--tRNA ligase [Alphaproteobacteria bacterium]